jgi:hypothetical protein
MTLKSNLPWGSNATARGRRTVRSVVARLTILSLAGLVVTAVSLQAQQPGPLVSPEVHALAVFSSSAPVDFVTQFAEVLGNSKATNARLKAFWIGCGKQDPAFPRAQNLSELLTAKQIRHSFRASDGPHTYTEWRKYLAEFAPLLFR